ncbi:MAG: GNAT superfamily N-acetyltransferase, partial [Limisphaerales bacterium]
MVIHDLENINITYSTVSKAELNDFVNSDLYKNLNELPISPWRAQSYGAHPRGEATDIILFLAWTDKTQSKLAAYLGVFPDYFYLNEKKWKVGWLSCMWVDPACRGKGVAKEFMKMAFKSWNGNIAVTEFTPAAEGLYNKTKKFGKLHQSNGLRAYLRAYGAEII